MQATRHNAFGTINLHKHRATPDRRRWKADNGAPYGPQITDQYDGKESNNMNREQVDDNGATGVKGAAPGTNQQPDPTHGADPRGRHEGRRRPRQEVAEGGTAAATDTGAGRRRTRPARGPHAARHPADPRRRPPRRPSLLVPNPSPSTSLRRALQTPAGCRPADPRWLSPSPLSLSTGTKRELRRSRKWTARRRGSGEESDGGSENEPYPGEKWRLYTVLPGPLFCFFFTSRWATWVNSDAQ